MACVQAGISTQAVKHVYITLTSLWKYSPKWAKFLREVKLVLGMPELKIVKPSDT